MSRPDPARVPACGWMQRQCADAGIELPGFVVIAVAGARLAALVGFDVQVCGYLCFQDHLDDPLDEHPEKIRVTRQDGLCCCRRAGTLPVSHRFPPSIRLVATTDRRWPRVKAANYLQKIPGTTADQRDPVRRKCP